MKKLLLASALTVLASNAFAGGLYISPKIGYSFFKHKELLHFNQYELEIGSENNGGIHFGVAVGYDFSKNGVNLRVEGEYMNLLKAKTRINISDEYMSETMTANFFNANVYYDFKNSTAFTPYIGGGVGLALVDYNVDTATVSSLTSKFAWNLQAGLDYRLDDHNAFGIGYRFSDIAGKLTSINTLSYTHVGLSSEHSAHEVTLSYRYTF